MLFYIRAIVQETPESRTFVLESIDNQDFTYEAGQFMTFVFDMHGHEVERSFSLSSAPETDELPAITVKRIPNGEITRLLFDTFQVGDTLKALPPAGRFTLETQTEKQRDIFFIGAGSGITPLYALLKKVLQQEKNSRVTLLYSNHHEKTAIFFEKLNKLANEYSQNFTLIHLLSDPSPAYLHLRGRLNKEVLYRIIAKNEHFQPENTLFYLCGPSDFMRYTSIALIAAGYEKKQIKTEDFVVKPVTTLTLDTRIKLVKIHYREKEINLTVTSESILQAAFREGVRLPYSCRGGRCSACIALCRKGKVNMLVNEVLTDKDLEQGYILTCTGHPETEEVEIYI